MWLWPCIQHLITCSFFYAVCLVHQPMHPPHPVILLLFFIIHSSIFSLNVFLPLPPSLLQATRCPQCSRPPSMPRRVRSSSSTCASVAHPRSGCMQACCWCSCVGASAGGASSSPMSCRSCTTLNSCSSFHRTGWGLQSLKILTFYMSSFA